MKLLGKIGLSIAVLFILVMFSACGTVEYSVKDFADVTVIGYTEHGTLSIKVNDAAVNKIYADGKRDKTAALRFAETFRFSYDGQSDEDSYFSNGDVVTIKVTYDESMARALNITFIDDSFDFIVDGLEDKVEMSPFEGLGVKFNGVAPYGSVQLDKSNCIQYIIDNVTFYCDNYDLSNGDKVVVRAEFNKEIAERNGYVFTEDVKKYTVVGLSKYVTTMMGVTYDTVTAKMHRMVETYVAGADTSYKTLDWYFGEEDYETDTEEENSDDNYESEEDDELYFEDMVYEEDEADEEDTEVYDENGSKVEKKKKPLSDVQKIKNDFALSNFKSTFDYEPIGCYYALNSVQYSDNVFTAAYKVTGTFVCEDTNGSGYIKPGDTVVGEIYILASLSAGSVDIKNNLFYEDSVLNNYHAYSIRSYPEYEDMSAAIFGSTKYVVENLDYLEDVDAYNTFVKKQNTTTSRTELPHITIDSSTDTDNSDSSKNESEEASEENEDSSLNSGEENDAYYDPNNNNDPTYYDNDNYYDDYGYDGGYNDYGYDEGYYE